MKKLLVLVGSIALLLATASAAFAQEGQARVRVVHASPDAPNVDVLVNDARAFTNAPFKGITDYAELDPGTYNVKVVPAGAMSPVVIEADLDLEGNMAYTVIAAGLLEDIEPIVLPDNSSMPAEGEAHVRFVHLSPDAPAVDIAVAGGDVLFPSVSFGEAAGYSPVDAGSYDLEARLAGTDTVALSVPDVSLEAGEAYTIYAVGLVGGQPALSAISSEDAIMMPMQPTSEVAGVQAAPQFRLGFSTIAGLLPNVVGQPVHNEQYNPVTGDSIQQTTEGLLVWRKADNWTAFTDGFMTWVNGPNGLQSRPNTERFPWEAQ